MAYLISRNPHQLKGLLHGQVRGRMSQFKGQLNNQRLEMVEDADGNWFIHEGIKDDPIWADLLPQLNMLERVETINFKVEEDII